MKLINERTITRVKGANTMRYEIHRYLDKAIVTLYRNNEYIWDGIPLVLAEQDPKQLTANDRKQMEAGVYAVFGAGIYFLRSTYDEINSIIVALQAEIDALPDVKLRKLIEKRQSLISHYNLLLDLEHEQEVKLTEELSEYGIIKNTRYPFWKDIEKVKKDIADFDAVHPDITAKIKKDKEVSHERFLNSN